MSKPTWAPKMYRQEVRGATGKVLWSIALPPAGEPMPVLVEVGPESRRVSLDFPWWARTRLTAPLYVARLIRRGVLG